MAGQRKFGLAAGLVLLLVSACGDATGPGVEPEIRNLADSFEFQVTQLSGYSGTHEYSWSTTGTVANVDQSPGLTGGSARVTLLDARGTEVYGRSLLEDGTFASQAGQAGTWRVRVVFTDATGALNFRLQKRS